MGEAGGAPRAASGTRRASVEVRVCQGVIRAICLLLLSVQHGVAVNSVGRTVEAAAKTQPNMSGRVILCMATVDRQQQLVAGAHYGH